MSCKVSRGCLRAYVVPDGRLWFAQGLDIDYSAQGNSGQDAIMNFIDGLRKTIDSHIEKFDYLDGLLVKAPQKCWDEFQKIVGTEYGRTILNAKVKDFPYEFILFCWEKS